jgi:hypothetical protein
MFIAGLLLIASTAAGAGGQHTFLILQHPDRFILFNKYQQRLTSSEYRTLPPIAAMLVVREIDRLGDGLTRCAVVELDGERFYVRRDNDAVLTNRGGKATFFRNALALGDTVELHKSAVLKPVEGNGGSTLAPRTRAVRVFSAGGKTFVRILTPGKPAGWLVLAAGQEGSAWIVVVAERGPRYTAKDIMARLVPVVSDANRVLQTAFDRCSPPGASRLSPPSFRLRETASGLVCVVEPASCASSFEGSLTALQSELQRALLGTSIHPTVVGESIVIPLK